MGASSRQRSFYFFHRVPFHFKLVPFCSCVAWNVCWTTGLRKDLSCSMKDWVRCQEGLPGLWDCVGRGKSEGGKSHHLFPCEWEVVSLETLQCLWVRPSPHLPRDLGSSSGDKAQPCWEVPERKCSTSLPFHRWRNQGRTVQQIFTKDLLCAGTVLSTGGIAASETDD